VRPLASARQECCLLLGVPLSVWVVVVVVLLKVPWVLLLQIVRVGRFSYGIRQGQGLTQVPLSVRVVVVPLKVP